MSSTWLLSDLARLVECIDCNDAECAAEIDKEDVAESLDKILTSLADFVPTRAQLELFELKRILQSPSEADLIGDNDAQEAK